MAVGPVSPPAVWSVALRSMGALAAVAAVMPPVALVVLAATRAAFWSVVQEVMAAGPVGPRALMGQPGARVALDLPGRTVVVVVVVAVARPRQPARVAMGDCRAVALVEVGPALQVVARVGSVEPGRLW